MSVASNETGTIVRLAPVGQAFFFLFLFLSCHSLVLVLDLSFVFTAAIYRPPQRHEDASSATGAESGAAKKTPAKPTMMSRLRSWFSPTPAPKPEMSSERNDATASQRPQPKQRNDKSVDVQQANHPTDESPATGSTALPGTTAIPVAEKTSVHDATLGRGALPRIVERLRRRRVMADSGESPPLTEPFTALYFDS